MPANSRIAGMAHSYKIALLIDQLVFLNHPSLRRRVAKDW
jgi:hypothetical protein